MNNEIKPLHAAAIIIFFTTLIIAYTWANGKALEINGPNGIYKNQNNHLFIRIKTDLLHFNDSGKFINSIDLRKLGAETSIGDILFVTNSEIILRLGKDTRTFIQNFRAFLRTEDTTITPASNSSGLFRCNINTYLCHRFTKTPMDFNNAFHLEKNKLNASVFLSEASRHRIIMFDAQGEKISEYSDNLRFPNQIKLVNNQLYVTNTNHHNITQLNLKQNGMIFNNEFDVVPQTAIEHNETWPATVQPINNNWWVINMNNSMAHGGIYIFDSEWKFIKRINTKLNADPVNILQWHNNEILINEPSNFVLTRYTANGRALSDFSSDKLQKELSKLKIQHQNFILLSYFPIAIFIFSIIAGLIIGIRQQILNHAQIKREADLIQDSTPILTDLKWITIDTKYIRKIRTLALFAPFLVLLGMSPIAMLTEHTKLFYALMPPLLGLFVFILAMSVSAFFYLKTLFRVKIGIQERNIFLKDHTGAVVDAYVSNVYYDNTTIYLKDTAVVYANHKRFLFHREDMEKYFIPLLKSANKINSIKMFYLLYKIKHPSFYYSFFILVATIIMLLLTLSQ